MIKNDYDSTTVLSQMKVDEETREMQNNHNQHFELKKVQAST